MNKPVPKFVYLIFLLVALISVSCKKKKKLKAENNLAASQPTSTGEGTGVWLKLPAMQQTYFTTRTKINFQDSSMSVQVGASFRGERGKFLWGSVTYALGIEVARLLIRPDSAFVWDKFNGRLLVADYRSFAESYGAPASLQVLQDMLVMGKVSWLEEMEKTRSSTNDTTKLAAVTSGALHRSWLVGERVYSQTVQLQPEGSLLQITNEDFKTQANLNLPHTKTIDYYKARNLQKPDIKLVVEHSKFEFPTEKPDMPFDVPSGIKRVEIE